MNDTEVLMKKTILLSASALILLLSPLYSQDNVTMKKGELAKVAAKLGIDTGGKTKAQLLELINNYSEE